MHSNREDAEYCKHRTASKFKLKKDDTKESSPNFEIKWIEELLASRMGVTFGSECFNSEECGKKLSNRPLTC